MSLKRESAQTIANRSFIAAEAITTNMALGGSGGNITISSIQVTNANYTPFSPVTSYINTTGGYISIFGTGFSTNNQVYIRGIPAISTTFVNSTQINAQVSSLNTTTVTTQQIYVVNTLTNNAGSLITNFGYGVVPTYTGSYYISFISPVLFALPVYSDSTMTYNILSGTIPLGYAFNTSTGVISGLSSTSTSTVLVIQEINQQNQSSTQTITLNLIGSDPYFNSTTLLLNGETNTSTYIADASTNNFALTVNGSATPNRFSPLWGAGYYGNYFDGASGTISIPNSTAIILNTGAVPTFTIELWFNSNTLSNNLIDKGSQASVSVPCYRISCGTSISFLWGDGGGVNYSQYNTSGITINPNTWYHVAVVSNAGVLNIYVNGVSYATGTLPSYGDNGDPLFIGSRHAGDQFYQGYISNLRIVKGTAVYTSNFTPPTTPLTAIANTTLLTCQSANFVDNSTNAFTLTPTGTVKVVSNQPFGALPSGVQNYGSSLFDGSTGYLSVPNNPAFYFGTGDFTIEWWWYLNSAFSASNGPGIGQKLSDPTGGWVIYRNSSVNSTLLSIRLAGQSGAGNADYVCTAAPIQGVWEHWAVVRSGTTLTWYKNGVASGVTTSVSTNITDTSTTAPMYVGFAQTWSYYIHNSYISNLRVLKGTAVYTSNFTPPTTPLTAIANTALLTLQNKNGANNNTFYDDSTNNFPITRTGTPTQGTFTPFSQTGWSNYFNGSTDYLYTSAAAISTNDFTIECWFNTSSFSASPAIIDYRTTNTNGAYPLIYLDTTGAPIYYVSGAAKITGSSLSLNTWYHIAVSRSGTSTKMFVNGTQVGSTWTDTTNYVSVVTRPIVGTSGYSAGGFFTGYISNLRVVSGTAVYTSNFTPSITPLTAVTNTVWLLAQSNSFKDNSTNNSVLIGGTPSTQAFSPFAPGVLYSSANNGGSIYFNGGTDYLTIPSSASVPSTGNFTIETWVYPTSTSDGAIFYLLGNTTSYAGLRVGYAGYFYLLHSTNGSSWAVNSNSLGSVPINQWYHIAVTRNGNAGTFYINGVSTYTFTFGTLASGSLQFIGAYQYTTFYYFTGYLSNLRITNGTAVYTSNFTPPTTPPTPTASTTLLLLGTNTGVQDATGKNDIITVGSAKTQSNTVKYGTGAMYFDGAGSSMYVPSNVKFGFGTGNFTIEFWLYLNATTTQTIFSELSTGSTQVVPHIYYSNASGIRYFVNGADVITGGALSTGTWYHIAVCRSAGSTKMFINGTQTGSTYTDSNNYLSSTPIILGDYDIPPTGTSTLNGYIDDLRITNGVARYTANFTPFGSQLPTA